MEGTIAIIGGGNTAIDAARCAVRLCAKEVLIIIQKNN
jgi:NADPH-dependent glutamate synthase beta subunit-like oxidoreductase